ncbi:MAG: P-loop NTPase, partial [Synergistales bacterium]|nr:P-loop NTPase [Synergistales bacterium]
MSRWRNRLASRNWSWEWSALVRFDTKLTDQAYELRELVAAETGRISAESGRLRSLAVTSGKGGVGKSSISANLALALGRLDKRVALL